MNKFSKPLLIATAIVAAIVGALLAQYMTAEPPPPPLANGTVLTPAKSVPAFELIDDRNARFDNSRLRGHWSLVFFGFTHCPYVCPTTLAMLANMGKSFDAGQPAPQVVFVSVDTKRDTPEVIKTYLQHIDPKFIGVTGEQAQLEALTKALGVPFAIRPLANGDYAVDHSSAILAIDPKGRFHAVFTPPQTPEGVAHDMRLLMGTS